MNPKLLFFFVMIVLVSCNQSTEKSTIIEHQSTTNCIDKVIAIDDTLGTLRNHACETQSLSTTIDDYINGLKAIDFTNCPTDFTTAFDKHIKAWEATKSVTDKHSELRGEMHDLFETIENSKDSTDFKPLVKSIWDTWGEIETAMKKSE